MQFDLDVSGSLDQTIERLQRELRLLLVTRDTFPLLSNVISDSGTNRLMSECLGRLSTQLGKPIPMDLGTNDFITKEFVFEKIPLVNALKYLVAFNDSVLDASEGRLVCRPVSQALSLVGREYQLLRLMTMKSFQEAAELLKKERLDVAKIRDHDNHTLLHLAVAHNKTALAERLITLGSLINARDDIGYTPLHAAVRDNHLECVQLLLKNGADVTIPDNNNSVPLQTAVYFGYRDIAEALVSAGAPVDIFTASGFGMADRIKKMLDEGVRYEEIQSNYLAQQLSHGAFICGMGDPFHKSPGSYLGIFNVSPLHWAARGGSVEVVSLLISGGELVSLKDSNGETPLFWAAAGGKIQTAALLIKQGADVNATNEFGRTPLLIATRDTDAPELAKLLVDSGANVNARDNRAENALHKLAWYGYPEKNIETAKILLDAGADINAKNDDGKTPLDILLDNSFQNPGLVEVFRHHINPKGPSK